MEVTQRLWTDEAATAAFAQALARQALLPKACIELHGDLGAGKTSLVRHLLRALGVTGRIKSPTYALVETYSIQTAMHGAFDAWHFDFYRLQSAAEWEHAGFRDNFASHGLKLVEWPQKVHDLMANGPGAHVFIADVAIEIEANTDQQSPQFGQRTVRLRPLTGLGQALVEELR